MRAEIRCVELCVEWRNVLESVLPGHSYAINNITLIAFTQQTAQSALCTRKKRGVCTFMMVVKSRSYAPIASESNIILNKAGKRNVNFKFIQARNCDTSLSSLTVRGKEDNDEWGER